MTNLTCILIYSADWAISSTAAAAVLVVVCMILIACSLMLLKVHCVGINRDSSIMTSYYSCVIIYNNIDCACTLFRKDRERNRNEAKRGLWNQLEITLNLKHRECIHQETIITVPTKLAISYY